MKRIQLAIRTRFFPSIVQCSPVRTGSTLVWNALRILFPDVVIPKRHDLNPILRCPLHPCRIVATVRDPRDVIVSMLAVSSEKATVESVNRKLNELDRNGLSEMLAIQNRPRTLILRYEEFHADYGRLFILLQEFFRMRVDAAVIADFESRFRIEEVLNKSRELGGFEKFDPESLFHGGHVSGHKGVPGAHKVLLEDRLRSRIESQCDDFMKAFGYSS